MVRSSPKSFAQPDVLKTIQPCNLIRLLEPCRAFLEDRGVSLPQGGSPELDYLRLAGILAQPDEWMDSHVVEGLHIISNLGTDENFDGLLDIARRNFIEVDLEATAADLATRIWIEAPHVLVLKEREAGSHRRRKFETFRARDPEDVLQASQLPFQFDKLEADLEAWFVAKKRGVGCRVIRMDLPAEVRFLVQHGHLCKLEPTRKGAESTCTFFRPEKTDLVVYDIVNNELRISTNSVGELRLYREKFGKHIFGDPEKFVSTQKYTLAPLKTEGVSSLQCRDVGGIEWVRLTEIEYAWPRTLNLIEKQKADDVFKALELQNRGVAMQAELLHARLAVKLAGVTTPRPMLIQPPNIAEYGRGEEAAVMEQWLRARGFVVLLAVTDDEDTQSFMAFA